MAEQESNVVVAGASSGFGYALSRQLSTTGHRVVAGARRPDPFPRPEASETHPPLQYFQVDLTDSAAVNKFARAAVRYLGHVDAVVYSAANPAAVARAWDVDPVTFARVLDVGLLGFSRLVRALVPNMVASGGGSILAIGSVAGRSPIDLLAAYGSAKAALEQYCRSLAHELKASGVRVNCLGIAAETDLAIAHRSAKARVRGRSSAHPPLPDVADSLPAALWLLSPQARHVTGQTIQARQP